MKLKLTSLCFLVLLAGCSGETKKVSRETAAMTVKFNELVKAGKTTREQEKAYIDAIAQVTFQLDRAIRGTKLAETTKRNAEIEAKTGINPEGPIELNMDNKEQELIPVMEIVEKAAWEAHLRDLKEAEVAKK